MLVNGLLFNSEAWHSVSPYDLTPLKKIDQALLRVLLDSHANAPLETLYFKTGSIPLLAHNNEEI